jgi:UDP-N-acetylmuramoyl-L-alanyl-D-glutamate--2,6-diaminopimelate ligase
MTKLINRLRNSLARPYHLWQAFWMANKYDYPASGMTVIAVTGTNGKTTTCFMIYNMLFKAGKSVAMMTTVANAVNGRMTPQNAHMTTADTKLLNKRLAEFRNQEIEYLVLEVTSHALAQHRIFGVPIDIAVLTNLTHEHLDYHGTFAKYCQAKLSLFKLAANHSKRGGRGLGIINADDPMADYFTQTVPHVLTYGRRQADLVARQVKLKTSGSEYFLKYQKQTFHVKSQLPGNFNVDNSLAAVGVGIALGLTKDQIEEGISSLTGVEGRVNRINEGQAFDVMIDFGHTPDAFEKLLSDLKPTVKGRLISLFGSAGQRDETKRPDMGRVAAKYSDIIIITEDDPRGPVRPISEQIASGAKEAGKILDQDLFLIDDRSAAIKFAINLAEPGDMVVLMGKGHEKTIDRATGDQPWDEARITRRLLRNLLKRKGSHEKSTSL